MRYKFRGKRLDGQGWVIGALWVGVNYSFVTPENYGIGVDESTHFLEAYVFEVIPESVGQWTGLVDRHGKEIFEGDVVGFEDASQTEGGAYEQNCIGVVEWGEETASFEVTNRLSAESWEVLCECVVIGSIYDNPELMEV